MKLLWTSVVLTTCQLEELRSHKKLWLTIIEGQLWKYCMLIYVLMKNCLLTGPVIFPPNNYFWYCVPYFSWCSGIKGICYSDLNIGMLHVLNIHIHYKKEMKTTSNQLGTAIGDMVLRQTNMFIDKDNIWHVSNIRCYMVESHKMCTSFTSLILGA